MAKRIGLTMRVEASSPHGEVRDCLAHDWRRLLSRSSGDASWVPIPSLGGEVERFLETWEIDAVILTGGNDIGSCPLRDETECRILDYCIALDLPVLGVCRGLELSQVYFGGELSVAPETHREGRVHEIESCEERGRRMLGGGRSVVPSFHAFGVRVADLHPELEAWAVSEDGFVEGLGCRSARLVAVQWHPERFLPDPSLGERLLRGLCNGWD